MYSYFKFNPINFLFDILAPKLCLICNDLINNHNIYNEFICIQCHDKFPAPPSPPEIYSRLIDNFKKDNIAISMTYSLFKLQDIEKILDVIHLLKYKGFSRIGLHFGKELGKILSAYNAISYDFIAPIPIHSARRRERGYNQSEEIANGVSEIINIPINNKIVKRKKYTASQTTLNKNERLTNISKAIITNCDVNDLAGKSILLIDDVLTTGSTLNETAIVLLENGAKSVDVATLVAA